MSFAEMLGLKQFTNRPLITIYNQRDLEVCSFACSRKTSNIDSLHNMWYAARIDTKLFQLKNVKNTHGGVLLFSNSNTRVWVFFMF